MPRPPKKQRIKARNDRNRWLVSYADFITLMFAFFVVMYAISSLNESKYRALTVAIESAFKSPAGQMNTRNLIELPNKPNAAMPQPNEPTLNAPKVPNTDEEPKEVARKKMKSLADDIMTALEPLVKQGKVRLLETSRGVTVEINDSVLFAVGQATLQPESQDALGAIAQILARTRFPVTIEGHTDNSPIATAQFPSNWELSAVRATTVLRLFNAMGVNASQLTAIGYGDTRPVETNSTLEGRARNRRVSILIDSVRPEEPTDITDSEELNPESATKPVSETPAPEVSNP